MAYASFSGIVKTEKETAEVTTFKQGLSSETIACASSSNTLTEIFKEEEYIQPKIKVESFWSVSTDSTDSVLKSKPNNDVFKAENISPPENEIKLSKEVKNEDVSDLPTYWSVSTNNASTSVTATIKQEQPDLSSEQSPAQNQSAEELSESERDKVDGEETITPAAASKRTISKRVWDKSLTQRKSGENSLPNTTMINNYTKITLLERQHIPVMYVENVSLSHPI